MPRTITTPSRGDPVGPDPPPRHSITTTTTHLIHAELTFEPDQRADVEHDGDRYLVTGIVGHYSAGDRGRATLRVAARACRTDQRGDGFRDLLSRWAAAAAGCDDYAHASGQVLALEDRMTSEPDLAPHWVDVHPVTRFWVAARKVGFDQLLNPRVPA